jgi:hypothetical protein
MTGSSKLTFIKLIHTIIWIIPASENFPVHILYYKLVTQQTPWGSQTTLLNITKRSVMQSY